MLSFDVAKAMLKDALGEACFKSQLTDPSKNLSRKGIPESVMVRLILDQALATQEPFDLNSATESGFWD
jgi:hypothetical protein